MEYMKPVKVKLNKEERSLYYDFNVVSDYEDEADMSAIYAVSKKRLGFSTIRGLYWAGLKHEGKGESVEEVGNLLQKSVQSKEHSLGSLADPLLKALRDSGVLDLNAKN